MSDKRAAQLETDQLSSREKYLVSLLYTSLTALTTQHHAADLVNCAIQYTNSMYPKKRRSRSPRTPHD